MGLDIIVNRHIQEQLQEPWWHDFFILFPEVCRLLGQSVVSVLLLRLSPFKKNGTGVGQTLFATVLHLCVCATSYAWAVLESWRPRHNSWSPAYDCPVCFEWTDGRVENHVSDVTHSLPHALLTSYQSLSFSLFHSLFLLTCICLQSCDNIFATVGSG